MADNNYVEGNSQANSYALTNPYANPSNFAKLKGINKVDYCDFLASFSYVIASGGATATITPITGNNSAALRYYTVSVYDGTNRVANQLDLASPAAPFIVDTSSLDAGADWVLEFSAEKGGSAGDAGCSLQYQKEVGSPAAGAISGDTIPADWTNVSFILKQTSTDDANFTLFPADGLEIADGDTVDLTDYLSVGTTLTVGKNYIFTVEMKKLGYDVDLKAVPSYDAGVVASHTDDVTFPYELGMSFKQVASAITIETAAPATTTGDVVYTLNGDAKSSVSFTLSIDVA